MRVVFGVDLTYFYWSCAAGIVLAALYDTLRIKRRLVYIRPTCSSISRILSVWLYSEL